jgi:hypothetical protein
MGTNGYIRQRGLTIEQRNAIDLLVTGKTDTETADAVGVHRVTVTKWRNGDPWFQAELNRRRQEIWAAAGERLRALLPKAIDALEGDLSNTDSRLTAALHVIKLAGLTNAPPPTGPTEGREIIDGIFGRHLAAIKAARWAHLTPQDLSDKWLYPSAFTESPEEQADDIRAALRATRKELKARLADGSPSE